MVYESLLVFGVMFFTSLIFDISTQSRQASMYRHTREAILFVTIGIYFVYFWSRGGQTLAMQTWKIKLVNQSNSTVSVGTAVLRYLLAWMWLLPAFSISRLIPIDSGANVAKISALIVFGMLAWASTIFLNKDRQFLHDKLAKTQLLQVTLPETQIK